MSTPTNLEFAELVHKMREKQVEYFRTRSGIAMSEAKKLEKEVDDALKVMGIAAIPSRTSSQNRLF